MAFRISSLPRTFYTGLCKVNFNIPCVNNYMINASNIVTTAPLENSGIKWEICVSTCIVRPPVITCPKSDMEQKFQNLLDNIEVRGSLKSDHEIQKQEEILKAELIKSGAEIGLDEVTKQTATEFEDSSKDEFASFKFEPHETDSDKKNDLTSCWRKLDRTLILTVNQVLGSHPQWVLPQTAWVPGESLRQAAERLTKSVCGNEFSVRYFGNDPCGFYKYKYSKENRRRGYIGAKVFFYKGFAVKPKNKTITSRDDIKEIQWLTHEQLQERMKSQYFKAVDQFVIPDQ